MPITALLGPLVRAALAALALAGGVGVVGAPTGAAEKLHVGKAVPEAFSFVPLDIGMRKGFFARNGLEIESIAFAGEEAFAHSDIERHE